MTESIPSDLTIRKPAPDEIERVAYLFRNASLPAESQALAAVRIHPIERFVAAVACWREGGIVRFHLACQPGVKRSDVTGPLIERVEESARNAQVNMLHYAESLADDNEWCAVLRESGFEPLHSERFFEVPAQEAWTRVMEIFRRHQSHIPAGWRMESIRHHPPELAAGLIGEHRLMPASELRAYWRADSPAGFELDLSSFLFDGANCIGALLIRRIRDTLCFDVRVVTVANPRLRALGNACLLHHTAKRCNPKDGVVRWLQFRAGEIEHRETANMAFRMKGRELPGAPSVREKIMNPPRRLLLVGWDAADWKVLHPLLDAGEMPALNRLVDGGVSGALLSAQPAVSTLQWTSIVTGKRAWQHGVCHSREIDRSGQAVPITARWRNAATLWEILARRGRRSLVVGWSATHGEQTDHTKIVSDRYPEPTAPPGVKPWPPALPGTYWPEEIRADIDNLRVSPEEVTAEIISRYVPQWRKVDQRRDRRIGQLRVLLAAEFSCQSAISTLMAGKDWDFAAVRFPALGALHRIFTRRSWMAEDEIQIYQNVIISHYRMLDLMLRRLLEIVGNETAVIVVSDLSPLGVFAASGDGFSRDALLHGASVLDVTPTVLTWFGIPIGDDMEGRVLVESFSAAPQIERVAYWESHNPPAGDDSEIPRRESDWNFAQSCLEAGQYEKALPVLEELFRGFPERAENSHALFQCQLALGHLSEAETTLEVLLEALPPGVMPLLPRAEIALAKRDFRHARSLVDQARQLNPTHPEVMRRIGMLLLRLREWDALAELANQALLLDENDAIAWLGLAEASLRKGDAPKAAEAAGRAIGIQYFLPEAHYVLARALVMQGHWAKAREAMETLLKLQPAHRMAPGYLRRMRLR